MAVGLAGLAAATAAAWWVLAWVRSGYALGRAEQAVARHDLDAAAAALDRSLAVWPTRTDALLLAAQTARRRQEYAKAESLLDRLEAAGGVTPAGRLERLLLSAQQGEFYDSEATLLDMAAGGDSLLVLEALARGYQSTMRWARMEECCQELLTRDPRHVTGLVLRGEARQAQKRLDEAASDYRQALELLPGHFEARLKLGLVLDRQGYNREAIYQLELARRQQPQNPEVLVALASARIDAGQWDEADKLLAQLPSHVESLVERGWIKLQRGRPKSAAPLLQQAAKTAPWNRRAYDLLAAALQASGENDALADCRQALNRLEEAQGRLGRLSLQIRAKPHSAELRHRLAAWLAENGQPEAARRWWVTALWIDPNHASSRAALAEIYERQGQKRRAARLREPAGSQSEPAGQEAVR
jgi:tetratricopeptide (TPR) repeat protein